MEKTLLLYTYVDGGINDTPFPNAEDQIEIGAFRYNATRMGAAPTITATVMHPTCLDNVWTSKVYAKFNGEKFYLKQTPTSSFDNEDSRYKHSAEFVSERVILDNVYFYDAVKPGDSNVDDRPVSNSTKFVFYGDIYDFANRLSASLKFSGLDYTVVVDGGITSEEKIVSFEDTFFSNAIQEAYNTYEVPYYFVGKEIHFGDSNSALPETLKYGVDNQLISITKTNKNLKIVNRITGRGSTENIPYYYPNDSPKGEIKAVASSGLSVKITDAELFSSKINVGEPLVFKKASPTASASSYSKDGKSYTSYSSGYVPITLTNSSPVSMWWSITLRVNGTGDVEIGGEFSVENRSSISFASAVKSATLKNQNGERKLVVSNGKIICSGVSSGTYTVVLGCTFSNIGTSTYRIKPTINATGSGSWHLHSGKSTKLSKVGLELVSGTPSNGSTIEQQIGKYVNTSQNLMPSIYRETDGAERFYNAINGEYGNVYFRNPFVEGQPKEHIVNFEDIKPTIKEATNDAGQRIDMFADFAYDEPDSDETYEDTEDNSNVKYKHGYFFAKLRKLPFNLFDHAIENQPMTISFTSGSCGSCKFKIGVTEEYPQRNPVQVDENGNLVRDDQGRVVCGVHGDVKTFQDSQQDTSKGEVWIALMKEEETYGILMPKAPTDTEVGHRPLPCTKHTHDDGDTFVITGIHLPKEYILAAEDKLKDKLIEYMTDNNREKFSFAIKFSRIYFEENQRILEFLNENSQIDIAYDKDENGEDIVYTQFVKSFSYSMSEGDILPDITVELDENLTVGQNAIQNAISEVRSEIRNVENSVQAAAMMQSRSFINKQTDDTALGEVSFEKGAKFGEESNVAVLDDRTAKLTIDYLEVKKKATFTSLEIQEKTHVGGQLIISPAAMTCNRVEEIEGGYRCYFQTQGEDGEEVFNQFEKDDLAICQTYNSWGSRYYWRKVVNVGDDYIDLSNADGEFDEGSDIPMAGDKIVQLGNVSDTTRQAAQILSAHGDGSPSFVMYNGIDGFSLKDKNITGIIWNPETQEPQMYSYGSFYFGDRKLAGNYITFQKKDGSEEKEVHINARITVGEGSDGLSNLSEWQKAEQDIEDASNKAKEALDAAQQALADMSWLDENITEINARLDGVVENYFEEGAPSLTKKPVTEWKTDLDKISHVGDTYTNIQEYVNDTTTPDAGKSWRWCWCEDSSIADKIEVTDKDGVKRQLHWHPIADSDAVKALLEASKAQSTADGKSTTYLSKPTSGYKKGDLWILESDSVHSQGQKGDILTANQDSTSYIASHWKKVVRYTDDSALEDFIDGDFKTYKEQVDKKIDTYYEGSDPSENWNTADDKAAHKGDLWYTGGESKVWTGSKWELIEGVPQSLYDDVDRKKQVFVSQPIPPYAIGDLWSQGDSGGLMICKIAKASGTFSASDWSRATGYSDGANTVNLVPNSENIKSYTLPTEYYPTQKSSMYYAKVLLPIKVNAGEIYTFKCESSKQISGSQTAYRVRIDDGTKGEAGVENVFTDFATNMQFGQAQHFTFTIYPGVENRDAYLTFFRASSGSYSDSVEFNRVSLVNGDIPMSVWQESQTTITGNIAQAINVSNAAQTLAQSASSSAASATDIANAASAVSAAANALANEAKNNVSEAITASNTAKDIADDAKAIADEAKELADDAKKLADAADKSADAAEQAAIDAKTTATNASNTLSNWSSDKVISPFEKQGVKDERAFIVADKADIDKQVTKYSLGGTTNYTTFKSKYGSYKGNLDTIVDATTDTVNIPDNMATNQSAYYTARTNILADIATAARKVADDAQNAADAAQGTANAAAQAAADAQAAAELAQAAAEAASSVANEAKNAAESAIDEAGQANEAITNLVDVTLPALEDGIITEAEKIAIEKYINIVNTEFAEISSSYATLSENKLIPSANKNELGSRYNAINAAKNTLITCINRVISGTSGDTKEAVDGAYEAYIKAYSNYKSYVETIYSIIESAIDGKADDAKSDAATAKELAQEAKNVANGASSTAANAEEVANNANILAGQAQGAAEQAQALVDAANNSAKEAQEAAEAADASAKASEEAAQAAKKAAEDGQVTVEEYQQIAEEAQEAAEAASKAAKEADDAAKAADDAAKAAQALADEAASDAASAAASASQAASDAKSASDRLDEWADDKLVSPSDIPAIENELVYIAADKDDIDAQLAIYEITNEQSVSSAFNASYTSYKTALENVLKLTIGSTFPTDVDGKQDDYYTKRTSILSAIATAAKKVADDAQDAADDAKDVADGAKETADNAKENADKAKEAADKAAQDAAQAKADSATAKSDAATAKSAAAAAKQATDDLDADLKFTVAEKRSIRKMLKDINPSETDSIRIWKWTTTSRTTIYGNQWTKITDESNAEYGWYVSNMHTHSGYTIAKINFTVYERSSIPIYIKSKAEENYDFVLLSGLNIELTSADTEDSTDRVVATTYERDGQTIVHTFTGVEPGNYFVTIKYKKDGSQSNEPDNGYYKIADGEYAYGSLGDLYRIYQQKGVDDGELDGAWDAAEDLFRYLYSYGDVWKDETTIIPAGFRDNVYSMFQLYYQYITKHQVDISTSDLQYLSRALANGKTITDGGLVMTSLVAVGDTSTSDTSVEAFLNGSSFANDSTHGKLILASGIPGAASDDNTDLEARAMEANTRIYEDGNIYSQKMNLSQGCSVGLFELDSSGLNYSDGSNNMLLGYDAVAFSRGDMFGRFGVSYLGYQTTMIDVACNGASTKSNVLRPVIIDSDVDGNASRTLYVPAITVTARGTYGRAIECNRGMFAGLRPYCRVVTSAGVCNLNEFDHTVVFNVSSGTVYVYLPNDPIEGQEYDLYTCHAPMDIYIYPGNKGMYNFVDGTNIAAGSNDPYTSNYRRHIHIFYAGGQWWENYRYLQ